MFNRKINLGRRQPPIGITVTFSSDRVEFQRSDITDVPEFASSLDKWQRIVAILKAGPQTVATIASELGETNTDSLDRYIRRYGKLFTKTKSPDHITRVALIESMRGVA